MNLKFMALTATIKFKHSPTPSQCNIKAHNKGLFPQLLLTDTLHPAFNKKLQSILQDKNKTKKKKRDKTNIRTRLLYDRGFRIIREIKITMINMLRSLMEKQIT